MRFFEFYGPDRDKHYYSFEDLGVLVSITSLTPMDRERLKGALEACLSKLDEDEHGEEGTGG